MLIMNPNDAIVFTHFTKDHNIINSPYIRGADSRNEGSVAFRLYNMVGSPKEI
jgi:hypothetical protein